jgi:DNA-binding CsgD family transcriptional regulator
VNRVHEEAAPIVGMSYGADRDAWFATALSRLAQYLGASRACLLVAHGPLPDQVDRFMVDGTDTVRATGPERVTIDLTTVPEWIVPPAGPRTVAIRHAHQVSEPLRHLTELRDGDWVATTPLVCDHGTAGALTAVGCCDRRRRIEARLGTFALMADLIEGMLVIAEPTESTASPWSSWTTSALDLMEEGAMLLDRFGRLREMNAATMLMLGRPTAAFDPDRPIWDQIDLDIDGEPIARVVERHVTVGDVGALGPSRVRVVGRQGLITWGDLTVRPIAGEHDREPMMVAVLRPTRGQVSSMSRTTPRDATSWIPGLTPREDEILQLMLRGHRVPGIADRLFLSPHTVRNHLKVLFRKAGVGSQTELIERVRSSSN